jgi:C4-dicarboxylate-specific signal transduction histidine kinase
LFEIMHAAPATPEVSVNDFKESGHASGASPASRIFPTRRETSGSIANLAAAHCTAERAQANQRMIAEITERERTDARLQLLQSEFFHAARSNAAGQMAAALRMSLISP